MIFPTFGVAYRLDQINPHSHKNELNAEKIFSLCMCMRIYSTQYKCTE